MNVKCNARVLMMTRQLQRGRTSDGAKVGEEPRLLEQFTVIP